MILCSYAVLLSIHLREDYKKEVIIKVLLPCSRMEKHRGESSF